MYMMDTQTTGAFLVQQASLIEPQVYRVKYPAIRYPRIVPVDTQGNPWVQSVTYFSVDGVGQAKWFNGRGQDVPNVELLRNKQETTVEMAAIGMRWAQDELEQAKMLNFNLSAEKGILARRVYEEFVDGVALFGDASKGFQGLLNNSTVAVIPASASGTAGSEMWNAKTPDQILADVNGMLTLVNVGSNTVELADTLLLPVASYQLIANTRISQLADKTILQWLRENNSYTAETGEQLTILQVRGLDTAGTNGGTRAVAYTRDPTVVKMHIPMPLRFVAPRQVGAIEWEIPGIFRLGGVDIRRPGAFRYLDGV